MSVSVSPSSATASSSLSQHTRSQHTSDACHRAHICSGGKLNELFARCPHLTLTACAVFVAWSGVICVAFDGWPRHFEDVKDKMAATSDARTEIEVYKYSSDCCGDDNGDNAKEKSNFGGLREENSGSMFPKMTLACLKKGVVLSKDETRHLMRVCDDVSVEIKKRGEGLVSSELNFDTVHACLFQCCSLERLIISHPMTLQKQEQHRQEEEEKQKDKEEVARSESEEDYIISPAQRMHVMKVLEDACESNIDIYMPKIEKDGNREDHYRKDRWGMTCVAFASRNADTEYNARNSLMLSIIIRMLREKIQPIVDKYVFFDPDSLHVTIRALL